MLAHYEAGPGAAGPRGHDPRGARRLLAGAAAASATSPARSAAPWRSSGAPSRAAPTREATSERGVRDAATRLVLGEMYADLGRYQWAGGELDGALASMEQALGIMPDQPSRIRARAQASLAQHLMIAGRFAESAALAREAIDTAAAAAGQDEETLAERGHALCTLGMDLAYLGDLERGLASLEESAAIARAGRPARRPDARRRQPDDAARPRLATRGGAGGRPRPASRTPMPAGWRPRTARSCAATAPTSCTTWGAGRRRRPSAGWRRTGA